jgi:hypothetical protein
VHSDIDFEVLNVRKSLLALPSYPNNKALKGVRYLTSLNTQGEKKVTTQILYSFQEKQNKKENQ